MENKFLVTRNEEVKNNLKRESKVRTKNYLRLPKEKDRESVAILNNQDLKVMLRDEKETRELTSVISIVRRSGAWTE